MVGIEFPATLSSPCNLLNVYFISSLFMLHVQHSARLYFFSSSHGRPPTYRYIKTFKLCTDW